MTIEPRDSFARTTARRAHEATAALRNDVAILLTRLAAMEQKIAGFAKVGRCALCGEPCRGRYCVTHKWAEGDDDG